MDQLLSYNIFGAVIVTPTSLNVSGTCVSSSGKSFTANVNYEFPNFTPTNLAAGEFELIPFGAYVGEEKSRYTLHEPENSKLGVPLNKVPKGTESLEQVLMMIKNHEF